MRALFMHHQRGFTADECDMITAFAEGLEKERATIRDAGVMESMRKGDVAWLLRDDARLRWIFDRLVVFAIEANVKCFGFEMTNWPRLSFGNAQFTHYEAPGDEFKWHRDMPLVDHPKLEVDRKITVCVMLSDRGDYDGGEFRLEEANLTGKYGQKGDVIVFPSILKHAVEPVTRGTRNVLALWFNGPPLK